MGTVLIKNDVNKITKLRINRSLKTNVKKINFPERLIRHSHEKNVLLYFY